MWTRYENEAICIITYPREQVVINNYTRSKCGNNVEKFRRFAEIKMLTLLSYPGMVAYFLFDIINLAPEIGIDLNSTGYFFLCMDYGGVVSPA